MFRKTTGIAVTVGCVVAVLSSVGALALSEFAPSSGARGLSLSTFKQVQENVLAEVTLGLTQTLSEDTGRNVRVLVHSFRFRKDGEVSPMFYAQGLTTVEAGRRKAAEIEFSGGGVKVHFTVQPRASLTWDEVATRHDVEMRFRPTSQAKRIQGG